MSEVPEVTLLTQDGREVTCTLARDPEHDRPEGDPRGRVTYYRAVPDQKVALGTFEVRCVKPPHTGFWIDVPQGGLETLLEQGPQLPYRLDAPGDGDDGDLEPA